MRNVWKRIVSVILVVSLFLTTTLPTFAAAGEKYICELRLVYADDYKEAKAILQGTEFRDYELLNENLNEDTGEIGVWLAYKTTTDIEDAITDISVMQMNGGYQEGNYQEIIKESYQEYVSVGETYLKAIDYFAKAYDAGHFLAKAAYRQLNFYTTITDEDLGIKIPDFDGELLGKVFYDGIDAKELATIFMQGNTYALENIRSLIAMGVSYNEDGKHYLEKVGEEAARMNADPAVYDGKDYNGLALTVAGTILVLGQMFEELGAYESEMDYYDSDVTEREVEYAEYKSFADRMREVEYLGGKTLYEFCLDYTMDENDLTSLYPLVAALNEGQVAMTKVSHYYDVVLYSMSDYPEEVMDEMISETEEFYREYPFDVYTGVDRSIFYGSFALTSDAYRASAYTEDGFLNFLLKEQTVWTASIAVSAVTGPVLAYWGVRRTAAARRAADEAAQNTLNAQAAKFAADKDAAIKAAQAIKDNVLQTSNNTVAAMPTDVFGNLGAEYGAKTYDELVNALLTKYGFTEAAKTHTLNAKLVGLLGKKDIMLPADRAAVFKMNADFVKTNNADQLVADKGLADAQNMSQDLQFTASTTTPAAAIALYIAGGLLVLYSAVSVGLTVYYYYNPDYDDIPVAMVDLINTVDGDRYIKYDVVLEAEEREKDEKKVYTPGDLNAFEAQRWNALYYTKNYEAGKPLLAGAFTVSNSNNKPRTGYAPVHRFGEVICYDLNKYNFDDNTSIYLSVKQSKNNKAAVTGVPELVGSIFSNGFWLLIGGIGTAIGVGGTLGVQAFSKKKRLKQVSEG